jgi:hypothetical protein
MGEMTLLPFCLERRPRTALECCARLLVVLSRSICRVYGAVELKSKSNLGDRALRHPPDESEILSF